MTKKTTRRALIASVISMLLCVTMLIGTTFAWFTDSVTSGRNKIVAGNLDIELEHYVNGNFEKVTDTVKIFDDDALWEPGHTEVAYLKVSNLGTLALKYQLNVNVYSEVSGINVEDEIFYLSDHLVFKVVDIAEAEVGTYTRDTAIAAAGTEMGLKAYNGETTSLDAKDGANDEDYVALIIYMPTTVGNEANYKTGTKAPSIEMGVELYATQLAAENDSFGNDYDENAWHSAMKVHSAADLKAALANGGKIILMKDIEAIETLTIPAGVAVELDLNGKTITGTKGRDADNNRIHVLVNNGNLTINGGTVKSAGNDGGSAICNNAGASLTINDVALYGAPQSDPVYEAGVSKPYPSYAFNNYGTAVINGATIKSYHGAVATGDNGTTIINDADIDVGLGKSTGITSYVIYSYGNAQVTVNGGKFAFTKQEVYVNGGNTFCELGTNPIMINGGNYIGTSFSTGADREYVIKGGTFDKDPSAYVADGFKTVAKNGKYVVISDSIADENVVGNPTELKSALSGAGLAGAGDTTIFIAGDIDMSSSAWTPITVDGYHGADIVTIEGNGSTITGLTAPLFAGGFAGGSGIVIKDLTIADSNIVSTNTLGSGAFIESVDSMDLITLTNCHLINSTVTGGSGSRTGGLIGWTAGYNNVNDGPVKTYVNIENCSVIGCTIKCDGSVGGIYGHAGNNAWTYSTIENCTVENCDLISTDDGGWRVGVVVGTANVGEVTISGITESGNTLSQTGKTAPAGQSNLYGRFVPGTTGKLVIDGSSVVNSVADFKQAIANGEKDLTISGASFTEKVTLAPDVNATFVNCSFSGNNAWGYVNNATYENCTFDSGSDNAAIHLDQLYGELVIKNCTFKSGKVQIGTDGSSTARFENCVFGETTTTSIWAEKGMRFYCPTTFVNCEFNNRAVLAGSNGLELTFENCTMNGGDAVYYVDNTDGIIRGGNIPTVIIK
ncbi:MAG: hypothetical protein IJZ03_07145 [Clostridia bacterium]|nr:hypothetical protein [Clostridia bacterium]